MKKMLRARFIAGVAFCTVVIGALALSANATVIVKQSLTGTAHAPRARGQARLRLKTGSSGTFSVKGKHLTGRKTFDVVVNKVKVGTLTTSAGGSGTAKFSTVPHGRATMLGFDPQGDEVEVRDEEGNDDLDGEMPDENPDSAIGCCLSQGDQGEQEGEGQNGPECENLTKAECAAEGGTATMATSCLPNPCSSQPPPMPVVCCIAHSAAGAFTDDDPEVECEEDESQAECAAQGGSVVQAPGCDPNPCQPTPPPQIVVCCVPEDGESECEQVTLDHCTQSGGQVNSATSCEPDPCGGGEGGDGGSGGDSGGDGD